MALTGNSRGEHTQRDSWTLRRRYMMATILFCKVVIGYILWRDLDSESAQTAVNMAFIIIGTTVSSYVFGAVWEDVSSWNMRKNENPYGMGGDYYSGSMGPPVEHMDTRI